MSTAEIQYQYDHVIAVHYDRDPLDVTKRSLRRGLDQLKLEGFFDEGQPPANVLDVGIGTGLFVEMLRRYAVRKIYPCGLDLSREMINVAKTRVPDLVIAVDDAANLGSHFRDKQFDLICTHFVTGFVPLQQLAPEIFSKLRPGGYWSFIGGTSQGFSELQKIARSPVIRTMFRGRTLDFSDLKTPHDEHHVVNSMSELGFAVRSSETFEPQLDFANFDEFMSFAWRGSWLTPFIEGLGLHKAGRTTRTLLNMIVFPVRDSHKIVVALAQKPIREMTIRSPS